MSYNLVTIFGAGLLTFVTPCVLPLIPIYLSALIGANASKLDAIQRGQLIVRASSFSLGFILVYTLMGLGASAVGAFLIDHRAILQTVGAILILVFALKFLGIVRIPALDRVVRADDSRIMTRYALLNAFLMGIVFAAGWSPCVGPVIGAVLTYTASHTSSLGMGALYLSVYGLGFAVPLIVTAAFAEAFTRLFKRMGPFMPRIEKAIGLLLLIVTGSLFWDATSSLQDNAPQVAAQKVESSGDTAEEVLPSMIEFYSDTCTICQKMKPIVSRLIKECDRKGIKIELIDISKPENRYLASEFRIVGVPTFLFLDENEVEVARLIGAQTADALKQAMAALRGESCPGLGPLPTATQKP